MFRKPPAAGGGVQTRVGVVVAVFSEALKIFGEKTEIELERKKS